MSHIILLLNISNSVDLHDNEDNCYNWLNVVGLFINIISHWDIFDANPIINFAFFIL